MVNTNISAYPWLCGTMPKKNDWDCYSSAGNVVTQEEGYNAEAFTTEAYGKYGLQSVYYKISENLVRDKIFGEDQLQVVERAFNFMMYTDNLPPNVRTYQIQGIWGEDTLTVYVGRTAFKYWSTYGGSDRNTPQVYDDFEPRIGDVVFLPLIQTLYPKDQGSFWEIRDVKYYQEAFGLQPHTYTLTLKVYKDTKLTILNNSPTIPQGDPIWSVATQDFPEQYNINDPLKNNGYLKYEELKKSNNQNHMDVLYNPNKDYDKLEAYAETIDDKFGVYDDEFARIDSGIETLMSGMLGINEEFDEFRENTEKKLNDLNTSATNIEENVDVIKDNFYKVTYDPEYPEEE
jgi:hypothetical protein